MNNPLAVSALTALLLGLAMPGRVGWWPLLFAALLPLFIFIARNRPGRSFLAGLLSGFLYHAGLLYWIVIVLGRYGGLPLWISVPALLLLSFYMSLYLAVFAGLLSFICRRQGSDSAGAGIPILAAAPFLWVGLDWLRSILFTGFPWMDIGYGLYSHPLLIQTADLGGHYLVSFALVLINALFFYALERVRQNKSQGFIKRDYHAAVALIVLSLMGGYSIVRYQDLARETDRADKLPVAVVQGNIPQDLKWTAERKAAILESYLALSRQAVNSSQAALVVWPETALPFYPRNDSLFEEVLALPRETGAWLLTGSPYFTISAGEANGETAISYYNSALMISPEGTVAGRYDKQHLVPYGEYVPLRKFMPFLEPLVVTAGNFTAGRSGVPLKAGMAETGVLICYESIFPDIARKQAANGANLLVNITNDAWYGRSSAPHQSFAMAVFRALENRLTLVRAANTGISGFVDPAGRVVEASPLFESLVLTADVPMVKKKTIYGRFGYLFGPFCLVMAILQIRLGRKQQN